jgi:hypothetical protein
MHDSPPNTKDFPDTSQAFLHKNNKTNLQIITGAENIVPLHTHILYTI